MPETMMTVDGFPIPVSVTGPAREPAVVVLGAAEQALTAYDALCERLHTATLRTVVIGADERLTDKSVIGILDSLDIPWGVLFGDRAGGDLAWALAATRLDRFTGLVVIDSGHPRVPDLDGAIADEDCPPVEINTTALATHPASAAVIHASQRYVYGDFRMVELPRRRKSPESGPEVAVEIVLRASTW